MAQKELVIWKKRYLWKESKEESINYRRNHGKGEEGKKKGKRKRRRERKCMKMTVMKIRKRT